MLRRKHVELRVALKKSEIYRRKSAGRFPAPVPIGERARAWAKHEIDALLQEHLALRRMDPGFVYLTSRPPELHRSRDPAGTRRD